MGKVRECTEKEREGISGDQEKEKRDGCSKGKDKGNEKCRKRTEKGVEKK